MIHFAVAGTPSAALSTVLVDAPATSPLILPSSGDRQDHAVASVRHHLRNRGRNSSILLPGGWSSLAPFTQPEGGAWATASINVAGQPAFRVSLPSSLIANRDLWIVTNLDQVAGHGPHVLDLAARYLRPSDRIRGLRSRDRLWTVSVNTLLRIHQLLAVASVGDLAIATRTHDPIAGELAALAIAELGLPESRSVTGVWEDPLVQRATELQLGVLYPGQLASNVTIATDSPAAAQIIDRILMSIGIQINDR